MVCCGSTKGCPGRQPCAVHSQGGHRGDDSYFEQWVEQQLNAMMGVQPAQEPLGGMTLMTQSNTVPAQFAAELSKGLAMGLKSLGPLKSPTTVQGGHTDTDTKQDYSNEDISALMGFAHVKHGNQLPTIWEYFNSYRGKSINIVWQQLYARMKQWSRDRRIPIKTSMYLEGTTIKALIELKFNPGEGVAHLSSADKGLSVMCCWGCTSAETEKIWECEDALPQRRTHGSWKNCSGCRKGSCGLPRIISGNSKKTLPHSCPLCRCYLGQSATTIRASTTSMGSLISKR
jgi:hypothetical protein